MLTVCGLLMSGIYFATSHALGTLPEQLQPRTTTAASFLAAIIHCVFYLLLFSNFIAAIGSLFRSFESALLFTAPVPDWQKYSAKLLDIVITSSWMAILFLAPLLLAYNQVFAPPGSFGANILLSSLAFLLIPALLASSAVIVLLYIIPVAKFKNILILCGILLALFVVVRSQSMENMPKRYDLTTKLGQSEIMQLSHQLPAWLPSSWFAELLTAPLTQQKVAYSNLGKIYGLTMLLFALGLYCFTKLYPSAWADSLNENKLTARQTKATSTNRWLTTAIPSQFWAIASKEIKSFFRDPTQSVQLLLLLILTFLYLYNFRTLQTSENLNETATSWWQAMLAVANLGLGSCVISAIATRLVFPSVSLEGKCFELLRSAPLGLTQLLRYKFLVWLLPVTSISLVLLVSGSLAIFVPLEAIIATAFIAVCLSISIVGLAIGVGSVYAEFDWDSPSQIATNYGSLVFMFFATICIFISLIPAAVLLVFTIVPSLKDQVDSHSYLTIVSSAAALCLLINTAIARHALAAGEKSLSKKLFE